MHPLTDRLHRYLKHLLLTGTCAALAGYVVFVNHSIDRVEGDKPLHITQFGHGATVTHAFVLKGDTRLHGVSVRIASDRSAPLRVVTRLLRLEDRASSADNLSLYTPIDARTETLNARAGEHWENIEFAPVGGPSVQWYAFQIRLLGDARGATQPASSAPPSLSIMASEDNPPLGGKLWIDGALQPGSLFIRTDVGTMYERFRLNAEPRLPAALRYPAVQAVIALAYLWAFVTLAFSMLFATAGEATGQPPFQRVPGSARLRSRAIGACQVVLLSLALAFFFVVPDSYPDNPANSLPLLPELVFLATLCLMAGVSFPPSTNSRGWSLRRDEKVWVALLVVWFGYTTARAIQSGLGSPLGFDPCGLVAPSTVVRLECRLQASFSQNYAWRNLSQFVLAVGTCVIAAFMTKTIPDFFRKALTAIAFVGFAHAAVGLAAKWLQIRQVMPASIMVNSYGLDRFTFFIAYPGYVWPQMAPALAISVWRSNYGPRTRDRLVGGIAAVLLAWAIFSTRQRGGVLLVSTMVLLFLGAIILKGTRKARGFGYEKLALPVAAALLGVTVVYPLLMLKGRIVDLFDYSRLDIWTTAVHGVLKAHPLVGFGYSRWGEFARVAAGTAAIPVFDSAHNVWIRVFFELGTIGFALAVACFAVAVLVAVRNATYMNGGRVLVVCAAIAFVACVSVDEIDYPRPVLVMHTFMAGVVCGLPFRRLTLPAESHLVEPS